MTLVQTAGVHGYSSPCPNHVVFSTEECIQTFMRIDAVRLLIADYLIVGNGCYKGELEFAYALPEAVFYEMQRRFPFITRGQESILLLGSPQARNWRPATLKYIDGSGRDNVDLGVWRSVTHEDAMKHDNWSFFNGHYFICEVDPPANMYEAQERTKQKKLDALEKIIVVLKEYFDGMPDDPARIAECLADNLQRNYDNGFVSGAEHMELIQRAAASQTLEVMKDDRQKYGAIFVHIAGVDEDD